MSDRALQAREIGRLLVRSQRRTRDGREACRDLLALSPADARQALEPILTNPPTLAAAVENSMALDGSGGPSLLAVLEPREIRKIAAVSREIFPVDWIYFDIEGAYRDITPEEARAILDGQDTNKKRRLRRLGDPTAVSRTAAWYAGPWALLEEEVGLRFEIVLDYLNSIKDADRPTHWKARSVLALTLELLALTDYETRGKVVEICNDISPALADMLVNFINRGQHPAALRADVMGRHLDAVRRYSSGSRLLSATELERLHQPVSLNAAVDELLETEELGTLNRQRVEEVRTIEAELETALREGLPE